MKRGSCMLSGLCLLCCVFTSTACTTTSSRAGMKVLAAEEWQCPKSSIRVTNEGANAFRVSGCGQSALYVCESDTSSRSGGAPPQGSMAEEEEYRVQDGNCHKASHD